MSSFTQHIHRFTNLKLSGGALYYAIFVSFVVFLFCGFIMLSAYLRSTLTQRMDIQNALQENAQNMVTASVYGDIDLRAYPQAMSSVFENCSDTSSLLTSERWGAFQLTRARLCWRKDTVMSVAMWGNSFTGDSLIAFYLQEKDNYITLSGTSRIRGNCYLPKLGYKNSLSTINNKEIKPVDKGFIKTSARDLPEVVAYFKSQTFQDMLLANISGNNVLSESYLYTETDSLYNSFSKPTICIFNTEKAVEITSKIEDNVKIISSKPLIVSNKARLNHVLIYAPVIVVEKGFKGSVQLFATDSLCIEENCALTFPSFAALIPHADTASAKRRHYLIVNTNATVSGGLMILSDGLTNCQLTIMDKACVFGQVYSNGNMELKGNIQGSVYASYLYSESTYGNIGSMLNNGVIESTQIPTGFVFPCLLPSHNKKIIKWLQ